MNGWSITRNVPIVDEVHKIREEILQQYGSLREYHEAVVEQQKQYKDRLVSYPTKIKKTAEKHSK